MTNEVIPIRPTLFYRLLQIILVPSLLLFVALTLDVILHPLAPAADRLNPAIASSAGWSSHR